ncbi:hypothetical protein Tco_0915630, partial [Tanacetum coccineum]
MRSQRATKIPLKFDNTVHSINNTKTSKRRNVTKNKGQDTNCKSVDCGDTRDDGDSDTLGNTVKKMGSIDNISCDGISVDIDSTVDEVKYDVTEDHDVNRMEQCNELNSWVRDTKVKEDNNGLNTDRKTYADA